MPTISKKGNNITSSPIRKLVPYADRAKQNGIDILHLNIGQPDIKSPVESIDAIKNRATVGEVSKALEQVYGRHFATSLSVSGVYGKHFEGDEDFMNEKGNLELVYKTKKYGIPCERKFEVNQNSIIIGFISRGCF